MLIMYLLGMLFHPVNVSSLTFALEVKSCSALCAEQTRRLLFFIQNAHSHEGKNYLNVMLNPPIFPQLLVLMW